MASLHTRCNLPFNGKDKLAEAFTERNSIPAVCRALTLAPAQALAPTPALASTLDPPERYIDEDLLTATKLALKLFIKGQEHGQLQANFTPREQSLKAWFSELNYGNFHLDCYRFCQQCKDDFEIARANKLNRVLFAALFLRRAMI